MIDSDLEDTKKKLWNNLNRKNSIDVTDISDLQRLLTFVEKPTFVRNNTKLTFPEINRDGSLLNPYKSFPEKYENRRKSSFAPMDDYSSSSKGRLGHLQFQSIINIELIINQEMGFMEITPEVAVALRQLTFGTLKQSMSEDWRNAHFSFKDNSGPLRFSMFSEKNSSRGFHVCVQAYFLKILLYNVDSSNESRARLLYVSESQKLDCLGKALAEILWKVGAQKKAFICLLSNEDYVDQSHVYYCDKITERINIFRFTTIDLLRNFIKKNINKFTTRNSHGCILFLYSIVLSKGLQELFEDFDFDADKSLLTYGETLSQSAINLIMTGHATDYLHNGILYYDQSNNHLLRPQHGIKERSEIGYLQYNTPEDSDYWTTNSRMGRRASDSQTSSQTDFEQFNVVGSMFKTPKYPIWVINGNGNMGVLFSLRDDLLNHWRAENNFTLFYLNVLPTQVEPCILSVTTRRGRTAKFKTSIQKREENKRIPILNHIINTKWFGCRVDWNNTSSFI